MLDNIIESKSHKITLFSSKNTVVPPLSQDSLTTVYDVFTRLPNYYFIYEYSNTLTMPFVESATAIVSASLSIATLL